MLAEFKRFLTADDNGTLAFKNKDYDMAEKNQPVVIT